MTLSTLWSRLRKRNKADYRQFRFCVTFAVLLVSSLLIMVCSPLIQSSLPAGGDSGKQAYLICGVAVVGCFIFIIYAARLFLRYKSREIGIFMALGAEKHFLSKALTAELCKIIAACAGIGIAAGAGLAFLVGKVMEALTKEVNEVKFAFTVSGFVVSLLYTGLIFLTVQILARRAMKRTNVIDVINEQRKQEPMKKSVSSKYAVSGICLVAAGLFVAVALEQITVSVFGKWLGGWTNLFYLLVVIGVYRLLVYAISGRRKGRNPQKYYNNLIPYGMMKFQGASVVKNMLVITLLIFAALFAISYIPNSLGSEKGFEDDFSYRYLKDAEEITREELSLLAQEKEIAIENYREVEFIRVVGSGVERDAENNELFETYYEDFAEYDCTSASGFYNLTGIELEIPEGEYYQIEGRGAYENIWYHYGDMDQLYCQNEGDYLSMRYLGNIVYHSLVITPNSGLGIGSRFIVNDADFARLKEGLPKEKLETQVLFKTRGNLKGMADFGRQLYKAFAERMSPDMDVMYYYNALEANRRGEDYADMMTGAVVDPENPLRAEDWQYAPLMAPLLKQQTVMLMANRVLLFGYVCLICFAAVGIIGFTRSQSVGLTNAQVFEDIKRLGADQAYRRELMKFQIRKVFVLPTIIGVLLFLIYKGMILYTNNGSFSAEDGGMLCVMAGFGLAAAAYQYLIYNMSVKKVGRLLKLDKQR